jgi:hypothetical protein
MHFQAYLDESYDFNVRNLYVFAGFYGDQNSWSRFTIDWQSALHKHGLESFHARELYEIARSRGVSSGDIAEDFIAVVEAADRIFPVACRLDLSSFDRELRDRFEAARRIPEGTPINGSLGNPWFLALQYVLERTIEEARRNNLLSGGDKVNFIFDQQEELHQRGTYLADETRADNNLPFTHWLGDVSFASRKIAVPLQAADLLAIEVLREEKPWATGRPTFLRLAARSKGIMELPANAILDVLKDFEAAKLAAAEEGE